MATAIVPRIYDRKLADEDMAVRTEDAHKLVRRLAREEGILGGVSSGAALWACMDVARRLPRGRARRNRHRYSPIPAKNISPSISGAKHERPRC